MTETGLVGFQWKKVKFRIRKLVICGFLAKQEAVRLLRKKLGVKKDSPKKKKPEKEPEPDPTAPADEGEDKMKVKKKKVEERFYKVIFYNDAEARKTFGYRSAY